MNGKLNMLNLQVAKTCQNNNLLMLKNAVPKLDGQRRKRVPNFSLELQPDGHCHTNAILVS